VLWQKVGREAASRFMVAFCAKAPGGVFDAEELFRRSRAKDRVQYQEIRKAAARLALIQTLDGNTRYTMHSLLRGFVCAHTGHPPSGR
jgi:hypothetical protein